MKVKGRDQSVPTVENKAHRSTPRDRASEDAKVVGLSLVLN